MIFHTPLFRFRLLLSLRHGKNLSFRSVHSRVFSGFCQTNRLEPARKVVQDVEITHTNLYEGPNMIFHTPLSRFRVLQSVQSLNHGKRYIIS